MENKIQKRIPAKINKTEIAGSISTELGCSLKYVFEISVTEPTGFSFEFSLPQNAVISGFAVEDGENRYESAIPEEPRADLAEGAKYTMRLGADGMFVFTSDVPPRSESLTLEVRAVVLFDVGADFFRLRIPLETKPERTIYTDAVRKSKLLLGCTVSINFMITEKTLCSVTSPTHEIATAFGGDALEVCADTVSAGEFELDFFRRGGFENTAYIMKGHDDGTGVYLFSTESRKSEGLGILYILDADDYKNSLGAIAADCLGEMLSHTDRGFMIADMDGHVFSDRLLNKKSAPKTELTEWLRSPRSGAADLDLLISTFASRYDGGEIVLVTCSGRGSQSLDKCGLPINVLSISESMAEYNLSDLANESGGVYARLHAGADLKTFVRAFIERVESGYLRNMKIVNYANGAYFKIPSVIGRHRTSDVVTYTFRTNGEFPEKLSLKADGGYLNEISFDRIIYIGEEDGDENETENEKEKEKEINAVFAAKAFAELYGYIARGDVTPKSVKDLKLRAVEFSREFGVLCPETSFEISGPDGVRACAAKFTLRLERPEAEDDRKIENAILRDCSSFIPEAERAVAVCGLIYRLLACMRPDGTYHTMNADSKTAAAYAASAIRAAVRRGFLSNPEEYLKIAADAASAAGREADTDTDAAVTDYDKNYMSYMGHINDASDMLDAMDISNEILILCGAGK